MRLASGEVDGLMSSGVPSYLLILAVALVGVLHTIVPDHWAPIALLAKQRGWSDLQTARAAAVAGAGHTLSTLAIALVVWIAGVRLAVHYGHAVSALSSIALVVFGGWIAIGSLRELKRSDAHGHSHRSHAHLHRHANGLEHSHPHAHPESDWHAIDGGVAVVHAHSHSASGRTALLLIVGSSPMIEGIPAFFAASRYGLGLLVVMAIVFAACTIATYVTASVASARGMRSLRLGALESYGEVLSGAFIALLGLVFLFLPSL